MEILSFEESSKQLKEDVKKSIEFEKQLEKQGYKILNGTTAKKMDYLEANGQAVDEETARRFGLRTDNTDTLYNALNSIKELEEENKNLKARLNAINLLTPELEKISKEKEKRIAELEAQIEKMKKYGKLLQDICTVMGNDPYMV